MSFFKDKVAVITGGGGVLCKAFAKELAKIGCKVCVLDRNFEAAAEVCEEIVEDGGVALAVYCDVLNKDSIKQAAEEVLNNLGPCDILINGAGGNHPTGTTAGEYTTLEDVNVTDGPMNLFTLSESGLDFVFDLNIKGTILPTQEFVKQMVGRKGCSVLNISSMNAFRPLTKIPAYSAAKAAVSNFTQWLSVNLSKVDIRVNAIAPGFFVTAQNQKLLFNEDGSLTPRSNKILNGTPMARFGKPEELLGALTFLTDSEKASFITGVVLPIDGGFSAYSGV